ncbi:hypothetical protein F0U44_11035 [Nocardioides humilatus]|uniref:Uncharacterized protein n=1 Tax=Nocardioides humilatus TaxID=2607660 RepID=A0A5B1LEC1_9ACTN|nr:hypothetical protein [Nocardioides humilatus]KAA1418992.1 hypothetical protein F0U44_11035 [Nocardioides humilatus]
MLLGRRLRHSALALTVAVAPLLSGCALIDLLGGESSIEKSFEYLPADTFQVLFTDADVADDLDPSELGRYAETMEDARFNQGDVEWEAWAAWGEPGDSEQTAAVWKVEDDTDLDALADDLEAHGYTKDRVDGRDLFSIEPSSVAEDSPYPVPLLLNVLIDEDEQVVAGAPDAASLEDVAAVIGDDDDSLADDGGFDDLLDAADDDPEVAWLTRAGFAVCLTNDRGVPQDQRSAYADLGRPEARALFVSDDADVRLALQFASEDDAKDDLDAREMLLDDGIDPVTRKPYDELGDYDLEQDDDRVVIDEDLEGSAAVAIRAERRGGGPGVCGPEES